MNRHFDGNDISIGGKYGELVLAVGVSMSYSLLLPSGVLTAAVSIFVKYWTEKRALLKGYWSRRRALPDGGMFATAVNLMMQAIVVQIVLTRTWVGSWNFDDFCSVENSTMYESCDKRPDWTLVGTLFPAASPFQTDDQAALFAAFRLGAIVFVSCVVMYNMYFKDEALFKKAFYGETLNYSRPPSQDNFFRSTHGEHATPPVHVDCG
jgi:hypothetical protein